MKMETRNVNSVQRVVNFTSDDGKMLQQEHYGAIIPGITMVCDLPLLFTNGLPTCLDNLTADQLKEFVPYMIRCCGIQSRKKPKWWPKEIDFSETPEKMPDMSEVIWLGYLKSLVVSCYSFYGCEYALRLCTNASHKCRFSKQDCTNELRNNISLFDKKTRMKASTTTGNTPSYRRKRISANTTLKERTCISRQKMKKADQKYLCDLCDTEFHSLKEMQNHEKACPQKRGYLEMRTPSLIHPKYNYRNLASRSDSKQTTESNNGCASTAQVLHSEGKHKHTVKKINSSIPLSQIMAVSIILSRESGHGCKCGKLFVSSQSLREHQTSCQKKLLESSPNSSLSTKNMNHPSSDNRKRQIGSRYSDVSNLEKVARHKSSPKKKMRLLPNKVSQTSTCDEFMQSIFFGDCEKELETISYGQREERTPSPIIEESELSKELVLKYFGLAVLSDVHALLSKSSSAPGVKRYRNPLRYNAIPISSPLGRQIHDSPVPSNAVYSRLEKVERYCTAIPNTTYPPEGEPLNFYPWIVSWKQRKKGSGDGNSKYMYKYPMQQWWRMPLLFKYQMRVRERNQRLLSFCNPLQIKIKKLTPQEIESYTSCRSVTPKVRKLTSEEIHLYTNNCSISPKLRRLSSQVIKVYTCQYSVVPKVQKLSFHEIKKHMKLKI